MTIADTPDKNQENLKLEDELVDSLIDQEDALSIYLQSLLGVPVEKETVQEKVIESTVLCEPVAEIAVELTTEIATEITAKTAVEVKEPEIILEPVVEVTKNKLAPDWATAEIKCLSAQVDGLTILIPAEFIESIHNATSFLKPSEKMPVWLYELSIDDDEPVQIINTKKLIFGGVKSHQIASDARTFVILIDDGAWGLACDSIGDAVNLKSSDIAWRGKNGKRRWLAGTSNALKAVILDVQKIEKALIA